MYLRKLAKTTAIVVATLAYGNPAPVAADPLTTDWQPCKFEDGSGQARCVWDAKHQGNGEGHSLKITKGGTDKAKYVKITHKRAKHLLGDNHDAN